MTDVEHPEAEQRHEDQTPTAPEPTTAPEEPAATTAAAEEPATTAAAPPEEPAAAAEEPAAEEAAPAAAKAPATEESTTAAEAPVAEEPVAVEPAPAPEPTPAAAEEPTAEEPAAEELAPAPAEEPAPTPAAEEPAPAAPAAAEPAAPGAAGTPAAAEADIDDVELTPRQKPEIPGADLIPDIIPEGEEFLDPEAQAAAEAEAEAARAREQEAEDDAQPIANAAIDLAAGARYTSTGKRKTAVARVTLKPGTGTYSINGRTLDSFFPRETLQRVIRQPLETVGYDSRMDVIARMHGGGVAAQAGALRHGVSRALIVADPNLRGELKRRGFLTRDPRVKERKKAGLKKARKRPQFSKR